MSILAVHGIFLNNKNELLLIKRTNTGFCDGYFTVPGGHVEELESLRNALVREMKEEIGVVFSPEDAMLIGLTERLLKGEHRLDFFFFIKSYDGTPFNNEVQKINEVSWFSLTELPDQIVPHAEAIIEAAIIEAALLEPTHLSNDSFIHIEVK